MTLATAGYGTILEWNGKPIAEVTSISGPSLTIDIIDATHYTSPQEFKEFIAGFGDGGEIGLECNLIPSDVLGQMALITDAYAKTVRPVTITLGDPVMAGWSFDGLITKLDFAQPMDNKLSFSITIKISGVPVLAINTSGGLTGLSGIEQTAVGELDFIPNFANAKYFYATDMIDTASTWIKVTAIAATHTIQIRLDLGVGAGFGTWTTLTTGVQSGELPIGAVNSITKVEIRCYETGKIAKTYTIYIGRP